MSKDIETSESEAGTGDPTAPDAPTDFDAPIEPSEPKTPAENKKNWVPWAIGAGLATLATTLGYCSGCFEKKPQWEEVVVKEAIPQYVVTDKRSERTSYTGRIKTSRKANGERVRNSYEFDDLEWKEVLEPFSRDQQIWNDIDIGDEVRVRGSTLDQVDLRDRYVTGTIDSVSIMYFENPMGVKVSAQLYVAMTDANGNQVGITYEGIPMTAEQTYGKLLGLKGTKVPVKLPRASDDIASALIGLK